MMTIVDNFVEKLHRGISTVFEGTYVYILQLVYRTNIKLAIDSLKNLQKKNLFSNKVQQKELLENEFKRYV